MKNLIKYSFVALMAVFAFAACSDDDDSTSRGSIPAGNQVFFDKSLPTQINLSKDETSFTIPVSRYITDKEQTVKIELTDTNKLFTAPSEVTFAAGDTVAKLIITYDPTKLEYNDYKALSLAVAADQATPYANSVYSFTAGVPLTYTSLGKGTYVDSWFGHKAEVEILKCDQQEGIYRVVKPYAEYEGDDYFIMEGKMDDALDLTILKPGDVYADVTVTQKDLVVYPDHLTGAIHPSYTENGAIMVCHPSGFTKLKEESNWVHNKVLEYQGDGTPGIIQLAPYYYIAELGGWNQTADDDQILIYFPGNAPKDYSIETTFTGTFNNIAGEVFAMGEVSFGADIDAIKGIVVSAKENIETVAEKVASGDLEAVDLEKGSVVVPITKGLEGKLQLVIVGLSDGEAVAVEAAIFEYYGLVNPWKSIGKGQLTENLLSTLYGLEPMTYEVEIEENSKNPGYYRIIDAFAPVAEALNDDEELEVEYTSVNFEIDATDAEGVYIPMQSTGVDDGDGVISICSLGGYFVQAGYDFDMIKGYDYFGTLNNGVITLPVFDSDDETYTYQGVAVQGENEFDAGYNSEFKLVLPNAEARALKAAAKKAAAKNWKKTPWKRAARKVSIKKSKSSKQLRYASKFQRNAAKAVR